MLATASIKPALERYRGPIVTGALGLGALAYAAAIDPAKGGVFPACPFHAATGLWCPGCGSLRGIHDLLHGNVAAALSSNALLVVTLPLIAWAWLAWIVPSLRCKRIPMAAVWGLFAVALVFGVARNTTGFAALAP
ncbi:MAG: DUF2752 domain-containing protein [Acidimicrobiia bacterium]